MNVRYKFNLLKSEFNHLPTANHFPFKLDISRISQQTLPMEINTTTTLIFPAIGIKGKNELWGSGCVLPVMDVGEVNKALKSEHFFLRYTKHKTSNAYSLFSECFQMTRHNRTQQCSC